MLNLNADEELLCCVSSFQQLSKLSLLVCCTFQNKLTVCKQGKEQANSPQEDYFYSFGHCASSFFLMEVPSCGVIYVAIMQVRFETRFIHGSSTLNLKMIPRP